MKCNHNFIDKFGISECQDCGMSEDDHIKELAKKSKKQLRIYLIIRKNVATIWQNLDLDIDIKIKGLERLIYTGKYFVRKEDAQTYLKTSHYKKYFKVIGASVDVTLEDGRILKKEEK